MKYKIIINKLNQKAKNKQFYVFKTCKIIVVDRHNNYVMASFNLSLKSS